MESAKDLLFIIHKSYAQQQLIKKSCLLLEGVGEGGGYY
jgi:hypothetical protein